MRKVMLILILILMLLAVSVYALSPNFNINAGRRLARYASELVDENGIPDPNGTPRYSLSHLTNQATAQIAINKFGVTDPNLQDAIIAGWDEIHPEAIRVYRLTYPTQAEATVAEIKALIREKYPNFTLTKVVGKDDQYVIDLDGVE